MQMCNRQVVASPGARGASIDRTEAQQFAVSDGRGDVIKEAALGRSVLINRSENAIYAIAELVSGRDDDGWFFLRDMWCWPFLTHKKYWPKYFLKKYSTNRLTWASAPTLGRGPAACRPALYGI